MISFSRKRVCDVQCGRRDTVVRPSASASVTDGGRVGRSRSPLRWGAVLREALTLETPISRAHARARPYRSGADSADDIFTRNIDNILRQAAFFFVSFPPISVFFFYSRLVFRSRARALPILFPLYFIRGLPACAARRRSLFFF